MSLDRTQTLVLAILAYVVGVWLNRKVRWLDRLSIPAPIVGGAGISVLFLVLELVGLPIQVDIKLQETLILAFFATVGIEARFDRLRKGGRVLLTLAGLAILMLPIQNLVGIGIARLLGEPAPLGILAGSVAMAGGAGTAVAFAPDFQALGLEDAMGIGLAAAALGLIVGSVLGGPIGRALIARYRLEPDDQQATPMFAIPERRGAEPVIDADSVLRAIGTVAIVVAMAYELDWVLGELGLPVPLFVSTILCGTLLTNLVPAVSPGFRWPAGKASLALVSDVSLNIFLAMSVLGTSLATVARYLPLLTVILVAQTLVMVLYAWFVVFRVVGRSYEASVMTAGFVGLELGATPNAVACMTAITRKFGSAPRATLVVPLIGLLLFDFFNSVVIRTMLGWLSPG
ncbi:MAG: sodium/glutamate symporter [Planctomycetota bacterium]